MLYVSPRACSTLYENMSWDAGVRHGEGGNEVGTHVRKRDKIISALLESLEYIIFNHRVGEFNAKSIFEEVEARSAATIIPAMDHVGFDVKDEASLARAGLSLHRFEE